MNKDFHSRMNFSSNISNNDSIHKQIKTKKIDNIVRDRHKASYMNVI